MQIDSPLWHSDGNIQISFFSTLKHHECTSVSHADIEAVSWSGGLGLVPGPGLLYSAY